MKTLYFVRHAKSSWEFDLEDHKRPLNIRGVNDADLVSAYLKGKIEIPDLILSSDAERTRETSVVFIENLKLEAIPLGYNNRLYDFSGENVLDVIKSSDDVLVNKLMIFGHNYALTSLVNTLGNLSIENLPTSGFVEIQFNISSWKDLNKGKTMRTVFPKDLK